MRRRINNLWHLAAREAAFRLYCRHRQGDKPNILIHCMPRSGSTWIINTLGTQPGIRFEGRIFMTLLHSRLRRGVPDLAKAAGDDCGHVFYHYIHFEGEALEQLKRLAGPIVTGKQPVYPAIRRGSPYFNRKSDRVVYQVHAISAMIEWFAETFPIQTGVLLRHPIPNALSIMERGWRNECADFLKHRWFVDTYLTGTQVDLARQVLDNGSELEKQVLDWSLRMLVPIQLLKAGKHPEWLMLTYEQTTMEPEKIVRTMADRWDLPNIDAMMQQIRKPSRTVSAGTADKVDNKEFLLKRWRSKIDEEEERRVMRIPEAMDIDLYQTGQIMPASWALL